MYSYLLVYTHMYINIPMYVYVFFYICMNIYSNIYLYIGIGFYKAWLTRVIKTNVRNDQMVFDRDGRYVYVYIFIFSYI
jgi:hypothetical protein